MNTYPGTASAEMGAEPARREGAERERLLALLRVGASRCAGLPDDRLRDGEGFRPSDGVRAAITELAETAGLLDVPGFVDSWLTVLVGLAMEARCGNAEGTRAAVRAAEVALASWPRLPEDSGT